MALELKTVLWIVTNVNNVKTALSTEILDDTVASRNSGLSTLGYPNNTNKDPILTDKQFQSKFTKDYPTVTHIAVIKCLKDTTDNTYFYLNPVFADDFILRDSTWKSKETKQDDVGKRKESENA